MTDASIPSILTRCQRGDVFTATTSTAYWIGGEHLGREPSPERRGRVRATRARSGRRRRCIDALEGRELDDDLVVALGGPHAQYVLDGHEGGKDGYWPRVWAARGLLHAWDDAATAAIVRATGDEAWRVREMAAKVVARHSVGEALSAVAELRDDPVARVRAAAARAVEMLTAVGA